MYLETEIEWAVAMADDFQLKKVGYVAVAIGVVIVVLGLFGIYVGL